MRRFLNKLGLFSKEKNRKESTHIDVISSKSYANCDALFGIVKLEDNVYASIIKLYPLGTTNKMLQGKDVSVKDTKTGLIEVGSEVRYKFKEIGAFSNWSSPNRLVFRTNYQPIANVEIIPPADPEVPAKFVLLDQEILFPDPRVHFEEEAVRKFLSNKIQNLSIQEEKYISINIAGFELGFAVLKTIPEGIVTIKPNTHLSFILKGVKEGEVYFKIVPLPPPFIKGNVLLEAYKKGEIHSVHEFYS